MAKVLPHAIVDPALPDSGTAGKTGHPDGPETFFTLGGDSMAATELLWHIKHDFKVTMWVQTSNTASKSHCTISRRLDPRVLFYEVV